METQSLENQSRKRKRKTIGDIIVGFDDNETIEVILGRLLANQNQTISTAESCTGGKMAQMLTSVAGASQYFKGSVVTYSKESKIKILGVSEETIIKYGIVSAEVAIAMAENAKKIMNSEYSIATTGNAGPSKELGNAEVGTVFIAIATPNEVVVEEFNFGQPREKVIDRAVNKAFEMVQKEILKNVV